MIAFDRHRLRALRPGRARPALAPAQAFAFVAVVLLGAVGLGSHGLDPTPGWGPELAALGIFAVAMWVALGWFRTSYPHGRLGACNVITQARAAAMAVLTLPVVVPDALARSPLTIFAIAAIALALDGVDGLLARRARLTSAFGARFDMEVDAALAACLSLILIRSAGIDGALAVACLLVLGFSRYVFVLAAMALPWLNAPLPERFSRKAVCVAQIATLAIALLPVTDGAARDIALPLAACLVLWSFGRDVLWLARTRRAASR